MWVAKKQLYDAMHARTDASWDDPRLAALDIQWADLRTGHGVAERLIAAGRTRRLATDAEIEAAAGSPPSGTRAAIRGATMARHGEVVTACRAVLRLALGARRDRAEPDCGWRPGQALIGAGSPPAAAVRAKAGSNSAPCFIALGLSKISVNVHF